MIVEFAADAAMFTDSGGEHADNYRDLAFVPWLPQPLSGGGNRFTFELRAVGLKDTSA